MTFEDNADEMPAPEELLKELVSRLGGDPDSETPSIIVMTSFQPSDVAAGDELKAELEAETDHPVLRFNESTSKSGFAFETAVAASILIGSFVGGAVGNSLIDSAVKSALAAARRFRKNRIEKREAGELPESTLGEEEVIIYGPDGKPLKVVRTKNRGTEIDPNEQP
jgi:hypothetical protein